MSNLTQKAIMQAFTDLIREMPLDKITVSAVVRRCGISHNTFYYHYDDIYDFLQHWLHLIMDKYTSVRMEGGWQENVRAGLHLCKDNSEIVYHLFEGLSRERLERYVFSLSDDIFEQFVREHAEGKEVPDEVIMLASEFCRYAFSGFFLRYLWDDMKEDIDTAIDRLSQIFSRFAESLIDDVDRTDISKISTKQTTLS